MRFFNTAGPVNCRYHYCVPPLERFDLAEIELLIDQRKYFVLHAPRQTGKTSSLLDLMTHLNQSDRYRCLYINVEAGQSAREDVQRGIRSILGEIASRARDYLADPFPLEQMRGILETWGEDGALKEMLSRWSRHSPKPLILLIDEIDALVGDTLLSVLRQIRSGYDRRPSHFPHAMILCGVRDVRDYRLHSDREKTIVTAGSAFNIKAESLRLGDFTDPEIDRLFDCHRQETGQEVTPAAMTLIKTLTRGQPWLVNALGYEICFRMKAGRDRTAPITPELVEQAKETLILRRETHLDQLVYRLKEERVRRVVEPILSGASVTDELNPDDIDYTRDLGLIRLARNGEISVANPIYQEVIPRELAWHLQTRLSEKSAWYIKPNGRLDVTKLLSAFQAFFREHSEHWVERFDYKEAGPQLLVQAFLQRVVNSGGRIDREYGLGRGRTDILVTWPYRNGVQKAVVELKILRGGLDRTTAEGLKQIAAYMDRCHAEEGHLMIFDRDPATSWEEKIFRRQRAVKTWTVTIWGL